MKLVRSYSRRSPRTDARAPLAALVIAGVIGAHAVAQDSDANAPEPDWSLLEQNCTTCHNFEDWAGGVAFDTLQPEHIGEDAEIWEHAVRKLRGRLMPPPGEPQPDADARAAFIHAMEARLDAETAARPPRAGYVALHRLNRAEYANEIRALLDLDIDPVELLPPDFRSDGFENVAEVLQVTPTFLEQYIAAARDVSIMAVGEQNPVLERTVYPVHQYANHTVHVEGLPLGTRDGLIVEHYFPVTGEYSFTIPMASKDGSLLRSYPMGWLEYEHTFVLSIDGEPVHVATLGGEEDLRAVDQHQQPAVVAIQERFQDVRLRVEAGRHDIAATFIARTFAESDDILFPTQPGEGLDDIPVVVRLEVLGPFESEGPVDTPSRRRIFTCYPEDDAEARPCAESIVTRLASEAFRRPATHAEVQTLMGFYDAGFDAEGFESGVQKALMAILSSTKFLYRREEPPADAEPGETFALSDHEFATRLSFLMWSQGPDEELLALAASGELSDTAVREAQVRRMLADPRSSSLVTNFAFQWLDIESANSIDPDPRLFPDFDPDLRASFMRETELFIDSILRGDESVVDLLDAKHTFLNERLARHYGVPDIRGSAFRRVELEDSARWGILGKGGVLMQRSYPNRTSPVRRGSWILEALMGTPPASPPPTVEANLEASVPDAEAMTVRTRLEIHREDPTCNQCHGVIDPLGLALETFDAIGAWRDRDRYADGAPIDAAGQLAGGTPITGPDDLREALTSEPEQFVQTFVEKLMTYALGRGVEYYDMPVVREIVRRAEEDDYRFSTILLEVVESEPFGMKTMPAAELAEGEASGDESDAG